MSNPYNLREASTKGPVPRFSLQDNPGGNPTEVPVGSRSGRAMGETDSIHTIYGTGSGDQGIRVSAPIPRLLGRSWLVEPVSGPRRGPHPSRPRVDARLTQTTLRWEADA